MVTAKDVLTELDESVDKYYLGFVSLGHPYSYLIDCRLNVFRKENGWAIVIERLGFSSGAGYVELAITYYGNCLKNFLPYAGKEDNVERILISDLDTLAESVDFNLIYKDAKFIKLRGQEIELTHDVKIYKKHKILINSYVKGKIPIWTAMRLIVLNDRKLLRATDEEIYSHLPNELDKILVLDEWYHRDFFISHQGISMEEAIKEYKQNTQLQKLMSLEEWKNNMSQQNKRTQEFNQKALKEDRPSTYETWQMIAKVIETGNITFYKPTLKANTHWSNWKESGSL